MGKVIFDMTASLDGFVAGPNDGPEQPMGEGGMRLFDWYFTDQEASRTPETMDPEIRDQASQAVGVVVAGRRTYENAHGWNGEHPLHVPVFVVTHQPPQMNGKFKGSFVTDGVVSALEQAQIIAGNKIVAVASPSIAQQCLQAGLLDEISLHVVPVLLGGGIRMFQPLDAKPIELECTGAVNTPKVTHITYRVIK
ncbi:MAG: dihydrofolate reductase family protein [Chloroflexota bacterium]|nr:dihydrofolate reductase family protein [Anaerolineales bacterium]